MKKKILLIATALLFLANCLKSTVVSAQAPTITSFIPASGVVGSSVAITGTGFSATAAQNIVFFGATQATVTAASTNSLTVTVPLGATFVNISVTNLAVNLTGYSAKPFNVLCSGNTAFTGKIDNATGNNPYLVSIADIDGDGKPDLVVTNSGVNTISVFRNISVSGIVILAPKVDFATGVQPISASIGDMDGDGKPDVATANYGSATVSVLRNTSTPGTVSFTAKVDLTTGSVPYNINIGDIDGDGKPDLGVANSGSATVSVFRNTSTLGSLSFAGRIDFSTSTSPVSVSFGDIDGDGKSDMAVAIFTTASISVFRNTSTPGTISFAAKVDFATGFQPIYINEADIDGDNKPDLAAANSGANTMSVLRNTSTPGAISFAGKIDFATGAQPAFIAIGEIDGDGKPELVASNYMGTTVSVFPNTSIAGTVSFAAKVEITTGANTQSVAIGDIDGDGKPDIAVDYYTSPTVSVLREPGSSINITFFSPASGAIDSSVTITGTGFSATAAQDIVFFGATQATVTAASTTSLTVTVPKGATYQYISVTNLAVNLTAYSAKPFIVTLAGNIAFANKQDFTTGTNPWPVSIEDIDGDGKPDLVVGNLNGGTVSVFRNTSTPGTVSFAAKVDFTTGSQPNSISIGDIDGDGKPDLVVANLSSNTVSVFRNTSTIGSLSFAGKVDATTGSGPRSVSIGDIDGDGKPDVAVINENSNTVSIFRNTSILGAVSLTAKVDFTTGLGPHSVSIGDIDGDSKPDLAIANETANTLSVLRNTSIPGLVSFAGKVDFTPGTSPSSVNMADIDGDGKPDLVVADLNPNTVSVLRNTSTIGTMSFAAKVDFTTGNSPFSASIGDIDGDGKPDLALANAGGNTASVLRNTSTPGTVSFAAKVDFTTGSVPLALSIGDIDGDGKPDMVVTNEIGNTASVILQENLPQGSLTANGPFCASGTGRLTWTATTGTAPFTVVYNDGTANRTATNVSSGIPFNVFTNPVTVNTTYTLVSVNYPNNATRSSGFTGSSATITIKPLPTPTASSSSPVCVASALTLSSNGGTSFSWTGPNSFTSAQQNPGIVNVTSANAGTYNVSVTDSNGCTAQASAVVTVNNCLSLKMFLQGYYQNIGSSTPMDNSGFGGCLSLSGVSNNPAEADTVNISLMDPGTQSSIVNIKGILHTDGTIWQNGFNYVTLPVVAVGNSYYIRILHRNAMETWSANPVLITQPLTYNFSLSAASAFGNNMVWVDNINNQDIYAFWSGDVYDATNVIPYAQDGVIEAGDYGLMESDYQAFLFGYYTTDISGDGVVESADYSLLETNYQAFIFKATPW